MANATEKYRHVFLDPDFRPRAKPDMLQCYVCGRAIKPDAKYRVVHVVDDCCAVHPDDERLAPQTEDWFPIGMDCARRIGVEFTHPATMLTTEGRRNA